MFSFECYASLMALEMSLSACLLTWLVESVSK